MQVSAKIVTLMKWVTAYTCFNIIKRVNTVYCIYSELPTEGEWLMSSRHVEDGNLNNLREKMHIVSRYKHFKLPVKSQSYLTWSVAKCNKVK